jgi:hypothetical protein
MRISLTPPPTAFVLPRLPSRAESGRVKTSKYAGLCADVTQAGQPLGKDFGLLDLVHKRLYPNRYELASRLIWLCDA